MYNESGILNEVLESIKNRRSIRSYLPEQIKDDELEIILESAVYAPTAHNDQPWHFTVIQNKKFIDMMDSESKKILKQDKELMGRINLESKKLVANKEIKIGKSLNFNIFYKAPTVIVVSGKKNAMHPLHDCCAATQNMLIAAESIGIGTCWIGLSTFFFQNTKNIEKLNLPDGYEPYFTVTLGYKASHNNKAPKRNKNVVNYIK